MKKKVVCALLAALLLLSVCGTAFAGEVGVPVLLYHNIADNVEGGGL